MKGNKKIGITAEFVSIIKSQNNPDYGYFVSSKSRRLFNFFSFFFKKTLYDTFQARLRLSNAFDSLVFSFPSKNIVDLGAGFSLRGFNTAKKNYFDVDFPEIIDYKKKVLLAICKDKKRTFPKNYHLIKSDLLKSYSISRRGKSIFFAEGVISYFNPDEFAGFVKNLLYTMKKGDIFLYNERWEHNKNISYRIIRGILSLISRSRSNLHFRSEEEAKKYFLAKGFSKVIFIKKEEWNFIKLVK
jgi:O-methyltransferase involved in polyketide biosynthesis